MALVRERLKDFGVTRTEVDRGVAGGSPRSPAPYVAVGHVYVDSLEGFQKGMAAHGAEAGVRAGECRRAHDGP